MSDRDERPTDAAQRAAFLSMGLRPIGTGVAAASWCGPLDPLLVEWRSRDGVLHLIAGPRGEDDRARG